MDVTDAAQVGSVLATEKPTHLFHLAGIAQAANSDIRRSWDVNFGGSFNIAMAVREFAPFCRSLFCTSAEIYGDSCRSGQPVDENTHLDPVNPYGASKAASDIMIGQMAKEGLKAIRLRPFNHTGPGQSETFAVPSFAAQIVRIERGRQCQAIRVGNLAIRRDFLDVRDVVDAYVRAIVRFDELPNGYAINVASGKSVSIGDMLSNLLSLAQIKASFVVDHERLRANDCPITIGNADRAHSLLGWIPRFELTETLKSMLDWYRSH